MGMWMFGEMRRRRGLRMWVITLLERSPKNGAEIMDEMEMMTKGWWRPSPGSVYPLLESLVQEGFIKKREDGKYELTQRTKEDMGWPYGSHAGQPRTVEDMLKEISGYVSYFEDLVKSDKSKIEPQKEKIKEIAERLAALSK
ncbi:transcriptional regulator, PadR family [Candidatus Nitrososphaera evergladensis SR1]|jgi:DNA-binding PadR family transcriptional regulator|uniref:Transcriptional regulator, PadR family n=1 Tax=Candidatus Nitrososphaera evergladensis SR1 TaxID=1459636 RepID=A0A075MUG9_9ARCH|nr:PadR family transcriptional regulator [Candidatus Nitrososphaera evergladensis]AIF84855.1 transcriptional regulator, PadR family [Candidatus Nitrososphaera evergladensis SR1]